VGADAALKDGLVLGRQCTMGVNAALCLQGMDGMVKHPKTRKEQAYVIALGGMCIAFTCSSL
jgi:hypothetical protein